MLREELSVRTQERLNILVGSSVEVENLILNLLHYAFNQMDFEHDLRQAQNDLNRVIEYILS